MAGLSFVLPGPVRGDTAPDMAARPENRLGAAGPWISVRPAHAVGRLHNI